MHQVHGHLCFSNISCFLKFWNKCHIVNFKFTGGCKYKIYKLSHCECSIYTHPVNSKFTIRHEIVFNRIKRFFKIKRGQNPVEVCLLLVVFEDIQNKSCVFSYISTLNMYVHFCSQPISVSKGGSRTGALSPPPPPFWKKNTRLFCKFWLYNTHILWI